MPRPPSLVFRHLNMSKTGKSLVSSDERTGFVEAVLAGKLETDFSAIAYHFEGWLDKGAGSAMYYRVGDQPCTICLRAPPLLARDMKGAI